MIGTGAALAGLGGLAGAALTVNAGDQPGAAQPAAQTVETQTVVVRKVEHRIKRLKAKHHRRAAQAATVATPAAPTPAPVVQPAPVQVAATPAPVSNTAPIRTRTSGGSGRGGDDDGAEHEIEHRDGGDDGAEHADD